MFPEVLSHLERCVELLLLLASAILLTVATTHASSYYADCSAGADTNAGISEFQPLRTLARVNRTHFVPGDSVLFKRGTTCEGMLAPQGSGAPGQPISIGAYGTGLLPVIHGGTLPN